MEGTAKIQWLSRGMGGELLVALSVSPKHIEEITKLKDEELDVKIVKHRERRSRDSNALMWCVCQELAEALKIPKEEVYRKAIKDVGEYVPLPIREDAVEAFCNNWAVKGIGWFAEVVDDSKIPGYKLVFAYYGSSTYDTKSMSVLLDYLVDDAEQIGIVLKASKEIEERAKALNVKAD